jgi:hypothetical protein
VCVRTVHAQQMKRCQGAAGRTIYVDRECEVYGLRHIGTVQDRVTVAPALRGAEGEASSATVSRGARYSTTCSAWAITVDDSASPMALAVFRLIANVYLVGC